VIAVDTNVVLRLLVRDDEAQYRTAEQLRKRGPLFVSTGVIMETEWALRTTFELDRSAVADSLSILIQSPDFRIEDAANVAWALERHRDGADFADMLHLTAAAGSAAFATFDRKLARQAGPDTPVPVESLS